MDKEYNKKIQSITDEIEKRKKKAEETENLYEFYKKQYEEMVNNQKKTEDSIEDVGDGKKVFDYISKNKIGKVKCQCKSTK